ncbi:AarF/ABC1/UbiB kinase family protein [Candidatus Woesearchaeota archaeon]|nr:AarF/ABC1/UbiB kinase family protein [Candidatus Woesearchaeota archaeon]
MRCQLRCFFKKTCECPPEQHSLPLHFRKVVEGLGPTFVKLGQLLSLRPDVIPAEYCDELQKLQDTVSPFPFEKVKKIIEEEFNKPLSDIFSSFEKEPIAAASIAQVHKAKLKNGKVVAVKVMRPDVIKDMTQDIRILEKIADLFEKHVVESRPYRPKRFVQEFKEWTLKEIDFRHEAQSMQEMRERFAASAILKIPEVFTKYTSKKVLTMEFMDGVHINDEKGLKNLKSDRRQLACNAMQIIAEQTLVEGIFHADPHPGNILVIAGNRFVFLDFGIVGRISEKQRRKISLYMMYLFERDIERALHHILELAEVSEESDVEGFKRKMLDILSTCYGSLETNSLSRALYDGVIAGVPYKVYFPSDLVLLSKAFVTAESVGRNLYPQFSLLTDAKEPVKKALKKQLTPMRTIKNLIKNSRDYSDLIEDLPIHALRTLNLIEKGKLTVTIDNKEFLPYMKEFHEAHMVRMMGMIVAALILASGVTSYLQQGPRHMLALPMIELYVALGIFVWMILYIRKRRWTA